MKTYFFIFPKLARILHYDDFLFKKYVFINTKFIRKWKFFLQKYFSHSFIVVVVVVVVVIVIIIKK